MSENNSGLRIDWFDGSIIENRMANTSQSVEANPGPSQESFDERKAIGFRKLYKISLLVPPFLNRELERRPGFWLLFGTNLTDDFLVLIVKILSRLLTSLNENDKSNIVTLLETKFMESDFLLRIQNYLLHLPNVMFCKKSRNSYLWDNVNIFYCDALELYKGLLSFYLNRKEYLPFLYELVEITETSALAVQENHSETISSNFYKCVVKLKSDLKETLHKAAAEAELASEQDTHAVVAPNTDAFYYKNMSVFPTSMDFSDVDMLDKMTPNIIDGAYPNTEHYLDLQFKLLREDCFRPLIQGINQYMKINETPSMKSSKNIRVYRNVRIIGMSIFNNRVGFIADLRWSYDDLRRYKDDKSFMYGSLLLFTSDNFQTILCATVLDTSTWTPKECKIAVLFESEVPNDTFSQVYLMVESEVYFEPYHRVLNVLQNANTHYLPMHRYIVDANKSVNPPSYLKSDTTYCIKTVEGADVYFEVLQDNWPKAELFGLDESQMDAFKFALTKEFVVVQGPPGTGKTYLGTTIAGTLLQNLYFMTSPMLVICYTNHALDQFMEGLLKYTSNMIRLGGQSKSLVLQGYNLHKLPTPKKYMVLFYEKKYELSGIYNKIRKVSISIEECDRTILAHDVIKRFSKQSLTFAQVDDDPLLEWLFENAHHDIRNDANSDKNNATNQHLFDDDINVCFSDSIAISTIATLKCGVGKMKLLKVDKTNHNEKIEAIHAKIKIYERRAALLKEMMKSRHTRVPMRPFNSVYELNVAERWSLYFSIVDDVQEHLKEKRRELYKKYNEITIDIDRIKDSVDTEKLNRIKVVGMTTTMAARRHRLLTMLKPFVVIVEEAAEVLETHIVASLTDKCKHLILIGDHQQLRPTSAHYILGRKYNLEVSLFERMVRNGVHSKTLTTQRRMRRNIMDLLVPTIYEKLDCHPSVLTYPDVRGMKTNLYFFTHHTVEETEEDSNSCKNLYEAKWCVSLANYLRQMEYEPREVTILTTYNAQVSLMIKLTKNYRLLDDVLITTVDNFQGEESRIVILSLVRSNKDKNIGFLSTTNRICVALSRAKEGLYIFGNMSCLEAANPVWRAIKDKLAKQDAVGYKLTLDAKGLSKRPMEVRFVNELDSCFKTK